MGKKQRDSGANDNSVHSGLGASTTLIGGRGDDTYLVDDTGDIIIEKNNGGNDTVISLIDWTLGSHLENLVLDGTDDLSGTGNELNNTLTGNSGDNLLDGQAGDDRLIGGAGSDTLLGGDGSDTAVFAGLYETYQFEWVGSDLLVTNILGEIDILRSIEFLSFDDQVVSVSDIVVDAEESAGPQAMDDTQSGTEDVAIVLDVMANDTGSQIAISSTTDGAMGTVSDNGDGTLTYTPFTNLSGTDQFTYTIVDSQGLSSTATVTVQIASVNDAPTANADNYSIQMDSTLTGAASVLNNDSDPDGDALSISGYDAVTALGGAVQMNADGTYSYTPAAGFTGTDSFTYTADDGNGGSATATVSIEVADSSATPYYVEGLLYSYDYMRLNYPGDIGSAVTVTYTFLNAVPSYNSGSATLNDTFQAFSTQQETITRQTLDTLEAMTGLNFVEVSTAEEATITFGMADFGGDGGGSAFYPMGNSVGDIYSDIWLNSSLAGDTISFGSEAYVILLHELAHALGLNHATLPTEEDNRQYTLMETTQHGGMGNMSDGYTGYQMYDIAALQYLYGTDTAFNSGDTVYGFADFDNLITTIWDGGGTDLFDMSGASYAVNLDLADGAFNTVAPKGINNVAIAFNTIIENATGSAYGDVITGNDAANMIDGGGGDDILTGSGGDDIFLFSGAWGNDTITDFTQGEDQIDLTGTGAQFSQLDISSNAEGDVLVSYLGNTVLLEGVTEVAEPDFLFG